MTTETGPTIFPKLKWTLLCGHLVVWIFCHVDNLCVDIKEYELQTLLLLVTKKNFVNVLRQALPIEEVTMSWISPTFGGDDPPKEPPKKKSKATKASSVETETVPNFGPSLQSSSWLEKYKPKTISDLVVNAKKLNELEVWLKDSSKPNSNNKFLLVTGPSGCGKTSSIQVVCKSLGMKVMEWITPVDRPSSDFDYDFTPKFEYAKSAVKTFEEYIFRSSRYNSCLVSNPSKKIVLVKDFPNAFLYNPNSFQDILLNFRDKCVTPIVFVCSDDNHCRKLFPQALKCECQVETVTFNPATDQRLLKLLKTILLQESRSNSNVKMLSDDNIAAICAACEGDIRSAISKLNFCSITSNFEMQFLKSTKGAKKTKTKSKNVPTEKDLKLDFFHGIGRVLYPKKTESGKDVRFVHSSEDIVENFLCEPKNFITQVHENYPLKFGNINDLAEATERMSVSDRLMSRWQERDIFQYYSLAVAVQGLMLSNKTVQKSRYEPFHKSQTSRMEVDCKALELEGKMMFSDLQILDYERLLDVLPYSTLLLPDLNRGQMEYVRKTSYFRC